MTEWISVKERLPEKSGKYLVCIGHQFDNFYITHLMTVDYSTKHKSFNASDFSEENNHAFTDVTHWMLLPEPPVE